MLKGGLAVLIFWLLFLNAVMWSTLYHLDSSNPNWGLIGLWAAFAAISALIYDMWRD
jgi:hypothetical protein